MVRRFAIWHSATEPRTEIPSVAFFLIGTDASPLTSIATKRSKSFFAERNISLSQGTSRPHLYDSLRLAGRDRNAGE